MTHPFKKTFMRLAKDIDDARAAVGERMDITAVQDAQWIKLHEVDRRLRDLADDLLGIVMVGDVAAGKAQENQEMLEASIGNLADSTTLLGGAQVFLFEPSGIKHILTNAPERNAKIAVALLTTEQRQQWLDWLGNE